MLSLRTLLRHPIQFALMTLGIALGVAVMVGIDLANASAERAFDLSASAVTGRATHAIVASGGGVDEALYVRLRTDPQWRGQFESAPTVRAFVVSPQLEEIPFTLLGIDPFAEAPVVSLSLAVLAGLGLRHLAGPLVRLPGGALRARGPRAHDARPPGPLL